MPQDVPHMRTERYETIIIGGGVAGLAAAYELQGRDLDYLLLDPAVVLPAAPRSAAANTALTAALAAYRGHFNLSLRFGVAVRSLRRADRHFEIVARDLRYEATSVIVAIDPAQSSLDLRSVRGEPGLFLLSGDGRDASRIAEQIERAGL